MKFFSIRRKFKRLFVRRIRLRMKKISLLFKTMFRSKNDLLVEECLKQNVSGVNFLLTKQGVDVNGVTEEGVTPLIAACYVGNTVIAKRLIEAGADVNKEGCMYNTKKMRTVCDGTPLIVATKMRNNDLARMLIENGAEVDKKYEFGKTALIYAVERESLELVKTLVEKWADVNTEPMDRYTALALAVKKGNKDIAEFLLNNDADVNHELYDGKTIFNIAIDNKDKDIVELLIDNFANLDILEREREWKNGRFVESILDSGHIRFAIRSGDWELVRDQLGQCIKGKSIKYVSQIEKEIKDVADPNISNNMLETLRYCMRIGVDDTRYTKVDISNVKRENAVKYNRNIIVKMVSY